MTDDCYLIRGFQWPFQASKSASGHRIAPLPAEYAAMLLPSCAPGSDSGDAWSLLDLRHLRTVIGQATYASGALRLEMKYWGVMFLVSSRDLVPEYRANAPAYRARHEAIFRLCFLFLRLV